MRVKGTGPGPDPLRVLRVSHDYTLPREDGVEEAQEVKNVVRREDLPENQTRGGRHTRESSCTTGVASTSVLHKGETTRRHPDSWL